MRSINVVARWDTAQLPPATEYQMYRQLRGAFGVKLVFTPVLRGRGHEYETMEEALASCVGERVFLEPTGRKTIAEIPDGDVVIVVGNTNEDNLQYAKESERYRINTPNQTPLYGVNAVAGTLMSLWL